MPRDLILGTAGHIDHGKTSLVKALTGTDCDRLPEEKSRGITIDIGFAQFEMGDFRIGIVDVPGHERFIRNMLAGATGIDLVVLLVAADDGIMPQTREHLEILRLLQIRHGVIALTKVDLVDDGIREIRQMEIRDLVQGSFLADAEIVAVSTVSGEGLPELKEAISHRCRLIERRQSEEWFRLAIDRSFIVQGHGTVVTGTVISGNLKVGDAVEWLPSGQRVRVRSLQNHDQSVEEVHRGMRAAINLPGIAHEEIRRGQELAKPDYLKPSKVVTVRMTTLAHHAKPIKHRAEVRLHLGTAEVMATISLLDCDAVAPGQWGLAQLFLREPITCVWGQPFVLRNSSAEQTLGGGQILQPTASKIRRRHLDTQVWIEKLWSERESVRAEAVAWMAGSAGMTPTDLTRGAGIAPDRGLAIIADLKSSGKIVVIRVQDREVALQIDRWKELEERVLTVLSSLHAQFPLMTNHERQKVVALLDYVGDEGLIQGAIDASIASKKLSGDAKRIARKDFQPKLSANQRKIKDRIVDSHLTARFQPPEPASFANHAAGNAGSLRDIFEVAIAEGLLIRVTDEIHLHSDVEAEMRTMVKAKIGAGLTVAEIRDLLGTTRKYAVPICEYLDRMGVTRREGDLRYINIHA